MNFLVGLKRQERKVYCPKGLKMSLYDRFDLTRTTRKLKVPIYERIDLTRPSKLRCQGCRSRIQYEFPILRFKNLACPKRLILHPCCRNTLDKLTLPN